MFISLLVVILIPVITGAEELNPELVSLLPETTISTLSQNEIQCFNFYWAEKDDFVADERSRFQCPEDECDITTHKDKFCCHRYIVIYRLTKDLSVTNGSHVCLRTDSTQTVQPQSKVIQGFKDIVSKYEEECRPEYLEYGEGCLKVAKELGIDDLYYNITQSPVVNVPSIATNSTPASIMNQTKTSSNPTTPSSITLSYDDLDPVFTQSSELDVVFINTTSIPLSITKATKTLSTLSNTMSTSDKITGKSTTVKPSSFPLLWILLLIIAILALVLLFVYFISYYYRQRRHSKKEEEREPVIAQTKPEGEAREVEISTPTSSDDSVPSKADDTISIRSEI